MKFKLNIIKILLFLLIFPNVVFLIFWYKWYISLISIFVIFYLLKKVEIKYLPLKKNNYSLVLLTILVSIFLVIISVTCNFLPQTFDFIKHHLILCDLVNFKWPVFYDNSYYLSYNIAYYLIPAGIAKLTSKNIAEYLLFIQFAITIFIGLRYIQNHVSKNVYHSFLIIILPHSFFLFKVIFIILGIDKITNSFDFFFSTLFLFKEPLYLELADIVTQIAYAPQHFSALLISGCLMHYSWISKNIKLGILICCFTPLWSVFTATALCMILFFQLIIYYKKVIMEFVYILFTFIIGCVYASFFSGHRLTGFKRIWNLNFYGIQEVFLFLIIELIPYVTFFIFLMLNNKNIVLSLKEMLNNKYPKMMLLLVCICLLPLFLIFYNFDFLLRGGATFLFFLNITILSNLNKLNKKYIYLFVLLFSIGGIIRLTIKPIYEISYHSDKYPFRSYHYYLTKNKTIYDIDVYHKKGIKFQYISKSKKSIYYKFFAPKKQLKSLTNQPLQ